MNSIASESPTSFETALQELERLVQTLENGNLPLEESLAAYERGMALLKFCQETLACAEQRIRILDGAQSASSATPETLPR
ncbi:exodeoxyribonuclease VII small subunit [Sulfuricystis multivorans]|uniref:exodeoxyribonuclease VII small subunit n=1 Tax=Sulfuricystis multivorans TaxID=2211108 RepID=UPI000F8258CC|nr:exodeoxyribonuclease VII small subunit [Sulfuricystis multivorans]